MSCIKFKSNIWFKNNCNFYLIVEYENFSDEYISFMSKYFDIIIQYKNSLEMDSKIYQKEKWNKIFNKFHVFNKDIFNFEKVLLLDSDMLMIKPELYIEIFNCNTPAGCLEKFWNDIIFSREIMNKPIPKNYTDYFNIQKNISEYNCINAGVLLLEPNNNIFDIICDDIKNGWDKTVERLDSLKYRNKTSLKNWVWLPEQEYITGLFSGQWYNLSYLKYFSIIQTQAHHCSNSKKYWTKNYKKNNIIHNEANHVINNYPEIYKIFKFFLDNMIF
jgi:hypothetical protein